MISEVILFQYFFLQWLLIQGIVIIKYIPALFGRTYQWPDKCSASGNYKNYAWDIDKAQKHNNKSIFLLNYQPQHSKHYSAGMVPSAFQSTWNKVQVV